MTIIWHDNILLSVIMKNGEQCGHQAKMHDVDDLLKVWENVGVLYENIHNAGPLTEPSGICWGVGHRD